MVSLYSYLLSTSYQLNCTYIHVANEEAGVRVVGSSGSSSVGAVNVGVVVVSSALKQLH